MASKASIIQPAPYKLEEIQKQIFSDETLQFIYEIVSTFDKRIDDLYGERLKRKSYFVTHRNELPKISSSSTIRSDKSWKIDPLPPRLRCRHIDLGDVSPSNTAHFIDSLNTDVQSVQVDFDDGHCPSWKNQILGYHNVIQAVHGQLPGAPPSIQTCPVLMLRPRAWNIFEHNVLVNSKEVSGAIFDFAVLMFHCGNKLTSTGSGPFFYLSKVEDASEANLWNDIFIWTQNKLNIPIGTIKACVLIENILAAFQTVEILFGLRKHSLGLNCGIWDYIASLISKFGYRKEFLLPDRNTHISAANTFIKTYQLMIIKDCHERQAPATAGMAAQVLQPAGTISSKENMRIVNTVIEAKHREIESGFDGFLIYDNRIVPHANKLWKKLCLSEPNQYNIIPQIDVDSKLLMEIPLGEHYMAGLRNNITVTILFIYYWLAGVGHFFYNGLVEDSATTEISRWQVWQCIRHGVILNDGTEITYKLIEKLANEFCLSAHQNLCRSNAEKKRMNAAKYMSLEIFIARDPPDFITTHLNDSYKFRTIQNKLLLNKSNL